MSHNRQQPRAGRAEQLSLEQENQIMEQTKLVNTGEFTREDWDIMMRSETSRKMFVYSMDEHTRVAHEDALLMLDYSMGFDHDFDSTGE